MADLLTQHSLALVLGGARLRRLVRAEWLSPVERRPSRVLFSARDVHAALRRLERQACPPDRIEVARFRASEKRNGRAYVPKEKVRPVWDLDFSAINWAGSNLYTLLAYKRTRTMARIAFNGTDRGAALHLPRCRLAYDLEQILR